MLRFSRDNSSTNVSLRLRLRSLRPESVLYSTQLVGSQSVNPFVRCLQLIHRDSLMSGIFLKYYFFKNFFYGLAPISNEGGAIHYRRPVGRRMYCPSQNTYKWGRIWWRFFAAVSSEKSPLSSVLLRASLQTLLAICSISSCLLLSLSETAVQSSNCIGIVSFGLGKFQRQQDLAKMIFQFVEFVNQQIELRSR